MNIDDLSTNILPCDVNIDDLSTNILPCDVNIDDLSTNILPCDVNIDDLSTNILPKGSFTTINIYESVQRVRWGGGGGVAVWDHYMIFSQKSTFIF